MQSTYVWQRATNDSPLSCMPLSTFGMIRFRIVDLRFITPCLNSLLRFSSFKKSSFCKSVSSSTGLTRVKQSRFGKKVLKTSLILSRLQTLLQSAIDDMEALCWTFQSSSSLNAFSRYSYKISRSWFLLWMLLHPLVGQLVLSKSLLQPKESLVRTDLMNLHHYL